MKFFVASLLAAAVAADGHGYGYGKGYGYGHSHTKLVKKLVPKIDYVKVAKKSYVDVEVPTTEEKEITKTIKEIEVYSNDSGDGMESGEYVPSISSISGSTHVHNSSSADSCSDLGGYGCKKSYGYGKKYYGKGYGYGKKYYKKGYYTSSDSSSDSSSSSDSCSDYGYGCKKSYGYGKKYYGKGYGYGKSYYKKGYYTSSASEADHTHAHDGSDTYVHSHGSVTSVSSISADSSADEHVVEKQVTETIQVPATKIVKKPVITYETKAVKSYDTVLAKVQGPYHSHGYKKAAYKPAYKPLSYGAYKKW